MIHSDKKKKTIGKLVLKHVGHHSVKSAHFTNNEIERQNLRNENRTEPVIGLELIYLYIRPWLDLLIQKHLLDNKVPDIE